MIIKLKTLDPKQMAALHEALESKDNIASGGHYVYMISSKGKECSCPAPNYNVKLRVLEIEGVEDEHDKAVPLSKLTRVLQAIGLYPEVKQSEAE